MMPVVQLVSRMRDRLHSSSDDVAASSRGIVSALGYNVLYRSREK
jgi:hypothetical protein